MEFKVALEKLRGICSRQEKCPSDVLTFLKKWKVDESLHHEIIQSLRSDKFIDEKRYASAFVRDKIKFDHWGIVKIRLMLHQKGIDAGISDKVIKDIDKEAYRKMIGTELEKKRKTVKGTPYEVWARLARYGASRGYSMEDMEPFLDK